VTRKVASKGSRRHHRPSLHHSQLPTQAGGDHECRYIPRQGSFRFDDLWCVDIGFVFLFSIRGDDNG
jgi:hypothetical protein